MKLLIIAKGTYSTKVIPVGVLIALLAEIQSHMKAYGFTDIIVEEYRDENILNANASL